MKRFALLISVALLGFFSCTNECMNKADVSNSAQQINITWHNFDENSNIASAVDVMKYYQDSLGVDVFVISHPDSTGVGVIRYDDPTAEVFRKEIEKAKEKMESVQHGPQDTCIKNNKK